MKEAEDGEDSIIRLYERENIKGETDSTVGFDAKKCFLSDISENELSELPIRNGKVTLPVGGFERVTLRLSR